MTDTPWVWPPSQDLKKLSNMKISDDGYFEWGYIANVFTNPPMQRMAWNILNLWNGTHNFFVTEEECLEWMNEFDKNSLY